MNTTARAISPLRQRRIEDMRMRKLAPKTQSSYIRAVRHFAGYLGNPGARVSALILSSLATPPVHLS